jgi:L-fuculose-phosphate aldolase
MNGYARRTESDYRADIVEVCKRVYAKGFAAASDGNVSIRLGPNRILMTPSGLSKGYMSPDQLIVTDLEGRKIPPFTAANRDLKPSSEIQMHLEVYRQRPDVGAVVHAHPPIATACTLAGVSLARCVLPEVVLTLVAIPTAGYATPSTEEVPLSIRELAKDYDALLLERHGALTLGKDVYDAYFKLEKVEHTAQITLAARQMGRIRSLAPEEVRKIETIRKEIGLSRQGVDPRICEECHACERPSRRRSRRTVLP